LTRYWIAPWPSTRSRHATAFVGSCGVSIMTGPFDVTTNDGLQPRTRVSVQMRSVTCSIAATSLLGGGEAAVDADHLPGDEPRGIRGEEAHGADEGVGHADAPHGDARNDARLERRVPEEHRNLGRVHERRPDRIDTDAVPRPFRGPLPRQRLDRTL